MAGARTIMIGLTLSLMATGIFAFTPEAVARGPVYRAQMKSQGSIDGGGKVKRQPAPLPASKGFIDDAAKYWSGNAWRHDYGRLKWELSKKLAPTPTPPYDNWAGGVRRGQLYIK